MHVINLGCYVILKYVLILIVMNEIFKTSSKFVTCLENCGKMKILRENQGIIQTPKFPAAFPVPIKCRWVIDSSLENNKTNSTSTIYVYFTQLFVTSGLSITEYPYYDVNKDEGIYPMRIFNATDDVLRYEFSRTNYTYLVIDFELNVVQGNHLRVLYQLLDVYGFNITYEITNKGPQENRCTVSDCSLVGHCYANSNFTNYECSCFKGFFGKNCGYGPRCQPGMNTCENGGTCRYAGETLIFCECTEGYTGSKCDIPINRIQRSGCSNNNLECKLQCPYNEKMDLVDDAPCNCSDEQTISENIDYNTARYFSSFRIISKNFTIALIEPSLQLIQQNQSIENQLKHEIERHLKKNGTKLQDLEILNISRDVHSMPMVTLKFLAAKNDYKDIRQALRQMSEKRIIANDSLRAFPFLQLLKVGTNMNDNSILEGEEFILSCIARGSPNISFHWFKDGIRINVSIAVRAMWSEVVSLNAEEYSSMLAIEQAEIYDSGVYTCLVKDSVDYQQCHSVMVTILQVPHIKMKPMSITAEKGQNLSIKCLSTNEFYNGTKFGYTWLKNDELIKADIPNTYWEDLYIGGSILYLNNAQKSDIYKCNVHAIGARTGTVRMDILNKKDGPFCDKDGEWPITGGGATALLECPENYSDHAISRLCLVIDSYLAQWQLPDYSECISNQFLTVTEDFYRLTLGYQNNSVMSENTLNALKNTLNEEQKIAPLLAGAGESYVLFLETVLKFLIRSGKYNNFSNCTDHFFNITDTLLQASTSLINLNAIFTLSKLIENWTFHWVNDQNILNEIAAYHFKNFSSHDFVTAVHYQSFTLYIPENYRQILKLGNTGIKLNSTSMQMRTNERDHQIPESVVFIYKNLSQFLISRFTSSFWQNSVYELVSPVVHIVKTNGNNKTDEGGYRVEMEYQFPFDKIQISTSWNICCARTSSFGQSWEFIKCNHIGSNYLVHCSYLEPKILAIFATQLPKTDSNSSRKSHFVLLGGCSLCFIQCMVVFGIILPRWYKSRNCILYLKIQVCLSIGSAMLLFIYASCNPPFVSYPFILSGLQICLLAAISSHISILLVIYIDVISIKEIPKIKVSAVSVITISPMLLTIFAPLSRQINDEKLVSWWLLYNTLLFNMHAIVGCFLLSLFIFIYYNVKKKLFSFQRSSKSKQITTIVNKISFTEYTLCLFICTVILVITGTVYVNSNTSITEFILGVTAAFLGMLLVVFYIPQSKELACLSVCPKMVKYGANNEDKNSPELQTMSITRDFVCDANKNLASTEFSSHLEVKLDEEVYANGITPIENNNSSEITHDLIKGYSTNNNVIRKDISLRSDNELNDDDRIRLKSQNRIGSPDIIRFPIMKNNYISPTSQSGKFCNNKPEILTRVCVELGVMKPPDENLASGSENSGLLICSVDVEPCPGHIVEVNEVQITTMNTNMIPEITNSESDNNNIIIRTDVNTAATEEDPNVLDRISEDLDYLLNRTPKSQRNNISSNNNNSKNPKKNSG